MAVEAVIADLVTGNDVPLDEGLGDPLVNEKESSFCLMPVEQREDSIDALQGRPVVEG